MRKTFIFNWFPLHLRSKAVKKTQSYSEVKICCELCQWEEDKEYKEYISYYEEFFESNFTCCVFQTHEPLPNRGYTDEELVRIQDLEKMIINNKEYFLDEGAFKNAINELYELIPGRYIYIIFKTSGAMYTPIYIDKQNIWHRMDVFPITDGPVTEKVPVWKCKEFGIGVEKPIELERSYSMVKCVMEIEGRHPATAKTQGIRVNFSIEGYFMKLKVSLMYHSQDVVVRDLFNSDLKVIHSNVTIREPEIN